MALAPVWAQQIDNSNAPEIPFVSVPDYLRYSPEVNLGEVLAVAENSKGHLLVLNHPGTAKSGPLYGNATTQVLEFDDDGHFVRELGQGVYGLGYSHSARYDKYDNLWIVDKGTNAVTKFNPAGYVTLNLGRRPEGYEPHEHITQQEARHVDGYFNGPTDVGWDQDDNFEKIIYLNVPYDKTRQPVLGNVYVADLNNWRVQKLLLNPRGETTEP
ncbi:MAG: hypothetical protein F4W89_07870 [Acidobacteria bacterium]|nr:hypothetical protein [Acidobacteriota bacterium]